MPGAAADIPGTERRAKLAVRAAPGQGAAEDEVGGFILGFLRDMKGRRISSEVGILIVKLRSLLDSTIWRTSKRYLFVLLIEGFMRRCVIEGMVELGITAKAWCSYFFIFITVR